MIANLIALPPLLSLLAALLISIGFFKERIIALIVTLTLSLSLLLMLALDLAVIFTDVPQYVLLGEWFASGDIKVNISFILDNMALASATVALLLLLIVARFSINYLHREKGFQRFFISLCLLAAGILLIISGGNVVLTFVGWELAGISSYILIAYIIESPVATANANYALISNRIGDAGLIFAIFMVYKLTGAAEWPTLLTYNASQDTLMVGVMLAGFMLAAFAKSALLPFSGWVSRALEGPTPSSAIFYGSFIVHVGIFLLIRLEPLLVQIPQVLLFLLVSGVLTSLYGYFTGLVQNDVKSSLIASTTAQVGLMAVACGLGWFTFALWYLGAHAIFRLWQFLSSPSLIYMVNRPARPVSAFLYQRTGFYTAAMQRFWLDGAIDWLLLRPTVALAKELNEFDEKVISRLVGMPTESVGLYALQQQIWAENIGKGRGVLGGLMEFIAHNFEWFEQRLITSSRDSAIAKIINNLGKHLVNVEQFISNPRYLVLLIALTFVVII